MKQGVLVDTGPLVAFLNRRDRFHDWTAAQWNQIAAPMLTCEAVVSEACFLLSGFEGGSDQIMQLIQREIIMLSFQLDKHIDPVKKLLLKYQPAVAFWEIIIKIHIQSSRQIVFFIFLSVFLLDSDTRRHYRRNHLPSIFSINVKIMVQGKYTAIRIQFTHPDKTSISQ